MGAGFSKNAVVQHGRAPATWGELGHAISAEIDGLDPDSPVLEVLSAYEHEFGRIDLIDRTARLVRAYDAAPGPAHLAFAQVGFAEVITTNFDYLLEKAYDAVGKTCLPIIDEAQLSTPNRYAGPRLIKMHGDINHPDRLVITEDDYDAFLQTYPLLATSITAMFVDRTTVLVGYSLDDPDTRQLLTLVRRRLGRMARPMWALQFGAPAHIVSRYERRGVKVINIPARRGHTTGQQLEQLFTELGEHWRASVPQSSVSSDDRVTADLSLPTEPSRICYFAVPAGVIAWYRDVVFPLVEQVGLIPVTSLDVLTPPGTIANKMDALIDRAAAVAVELGGTGSAYEAGVALARKEADSVLLIVQEGAPIPSDSLRGQRFLVRPAALEPDPVAFLDGFASWISHFQASRFQRQSEPEQLLELRQYDAALISAVSLLEVTLAERASEQGDRRGRPKSIRLLLQQAVDYGLLVDRAEISLLEEAISVRNGLLHSKTHVNGTSARRYVRAIRHFVSRIV